MNKIFLIDDQSISNFINRKLLEIEGYKGEIIDFTNPSIALDRVMDEENILIFLDLNMPEMNGWQFLETLESKNIKHRIVILTSSTSILDRNKAKNHPSVVKFIVKPLNKEKLSKIKHLMLIS